MTCWRRERDGVGDDQQDPTRRVGSVADPVADPVATARLAER